MQPDNDMNFRIFEAFWDAAISRRAKYLKQEGLRPWFDSQALPPIIGFGLPADGQSVRLVTVGLNPSNREVLDGYIPAVDDAGEQWMSQQAYFKKPYRTWFDRAELMVGSASGGRSSYGGIYGHTANAVHLDVTVHPTTGKFDQVFDKTANKDQRQAAIEMLERESIKVLFPLIELVRRDNGCSNVLVFGFCPPSRGSRTMKTLWGRPTYWDIADSAECEGILVARGSPSKQRCEQLKMPSLGELNWTFISQGPSSKRADNKALERAASEIHTCSWFA